MSVNDVQSLIDYYINLNKTGTLSDESLSILIYDLIF